MRMRHRGATVLLLGFGAAGLVWAIAPQEASRKPLLRASEKAPYVHFGRREIPGANDPYFMPGVSLDALGERIEKGDGDATRLTYTALVWFVHSICALEEPEERRQLYGEASRLYTALVATSARSKEPNPALRSNAQFLIGAVWGAWKGSLDALARDRLKACAASKAGQYRLAAELLLEKMPVRTGLEAGVAQLLEGDPAVALEKLKDASRRQPDVAAGHYWRGVALYRIGRHEEAIQALDEAVRLDPKHAEAFEARAACRAAKKDWPGARADWEAVVRLDPIARGRLQPWIDAAGERAK